MSHTTSHERWRSLITIWMFAAVCFADEPANEKTKQPPLPPNVDYITLLNQTQVQDDLALDEKQRAAVRKIADEFVTELTTWVTEQIAEIRQMKPAEQITRLRSMQNERNEFSHKHTTRCFKLLHPVQRDRFDQIVFRLRGFAIFYNPDFVAELELTIPQQQAIAEIRQRTLRNIKQVRDDGKEKNINPRRVENHVAELNAEAVKEAETFLSNAQRKVYDRRHGPPITFRATDLAMTLSRGRGKTQGPQPLP